MRAGGGISEQKVRYLPRSAQALRMMEEHERWFWAGSIARDACYTVWLQNSRFESRLLYMGGPLEGLNLKLPVSSLQHGMSGRLFHAR